MSGGEVIGEADGRAALFVLSFRHLDKLVEVASGAGWRVVGAERSADGAFLNSGAAVAVVDARRALRDGLAAVRDLAPVVEAAGAALLVLVGQEDRNDVGAFLDAGATHFVLDPINEEEVSHAIRFAERYADRLARRDPPMRRGSDPGPVVAEGNAVRFWTAERLAAGRSVVIARATLASFDLVNSAHGREAGDSILGEASDRLQRVAERLFAGEAVVARGGGPKFLLAGDARAASETEVVAAISDVLGQPFGRATVGARVGVAVSRPGEDVTEVIRRAGRLLPALPDDVDVEALAVDMHHALTGDQVFVQFQPQVDVASGRIVGAEALARWRHPRQGEIGAEALFAAAGRAGLGVILSEHVQWLALTAAANWPASLAHLRLSVNVTAEDVGSADFDDQFLARVSEARFPVERLTAEVTESGLLGDLERAARLLQILRKGGCRTAIDDFGTGYSSLAYLNALPLDYLKLDKALVHGVERDGRERVVARSVLGLARSLGLTTIAEGVETTAQRDLLAAEGCELYQGFLCAGALETPDLAALVEARG